jgi:hypothetical protein
LDCIGLLEKRKRRFGKVKKHENRDPVCFWIPPPIGIDITRSEAKGTIGLKQVRIARSLLNLFFGKLLSLYEQEFKTDAPLYPAALPEALDQDEMVFANRKRGFIESTKRSRVLVEDRKVQEIREIAPSIRLDPQIILPALEIPSELSEPDVWSFIEGWLQGNLPGLIEDSFVRFKRSLPVSRVQMVVIQQTMGGFMKSAESNWLEGISCNENIPLEKVRAGCAPDSWRRDRFYPGL